MRTPHLSIDFLKQTLTVCILGTLVSLAGLQQAVAQPTVSVVPANLATGVSPGAPVVFTFSTAMNTDPDVTSAQFYSGGATPAPVVSVWSAGNTVLTCTPSPAFGNNAFIVWSLSGEDTEANSLDDSGFFTTGSGSGSGGSGTNAVTSFVLGKLWEYDQTNTAAPALDPDVPYLFSASTLLASNRTATAVTLTFPNSAVSNLQNFAEPENYFLIGYNTNLTIFNATYPAGNYTFTVTSNSATQSVTMNLPAAQPNAPHVSNYAAAQTINPSQPFMLTWDAFSGGTSADYISVGVDDQHSDTIFKTADLGSPNALKGTATSVVIPAGTLQAGSNYNATIGFFHGVITTNSAGKYIAEGYVATMTQFPISTSGSAVPAAPVLTNGAWNAGTFGFDILTSSGQTLTIVYNTNLTKAPASWAILLTTNSPGSTVHISDPHSKTNKSLFYRARNGS
jgi:Bacterial Ig-like domain